MELTPKPEKEFELEKFKEDAKQDIEPEQENEKQASEKQVSEMCDSEKETRDVVIRLFEKGESKHGALDTSKQASETEGVDKLKSDEALTEQEEEVEHKKEGAKLKKIEKTLALQKITSPVTCSSTTRWKETHSCEKIGLNKR